MTRRTTARATFAAGLAAALLLSGCNANAGERAVADFEDWWDDHGVAGVEISRTQEHNALPFTGSGEIWLRPTETVDVATLVERLCDYDADKETILHLDSADAPESIDAATGDRDVEVVVDCAEPDLTVDRFVSLLATHGLEFASIAKEGLVARFETDDQLLAAFAGLRELEPSELHLSAGENNAPGHLRVNEDESVPADIQRLVDAVLGSGVPVLAVEASEHLRSGVELEVVVDGDESDVERLEGLLLEVDPQAADLALVTTSADGKATGSPTG